MPFEAFFFFFRFRLARFILSGDGRASLVILLRIGFQPFLWKLSVNIQNRTPSKCSRDILRSAS